MKQLKFKLQDYKTKMLLILTFLMAGGMNAYAQKSYVLDAFLKHNIDTSILNANNLREPDDFSFEFKETTITDKTKVVVAKFNYKNPESEQWTVITVDGQSPTKSDIKSFRKDHNRENTSSMIDDSTYKVEEETSDYLIISYKQNPRSKSKDAAYMKDCRFYVAVNLKTKKLEQVQVLNEKPIQIKVIITAEKFDLITKYTWNDQAKRYFPTDKTLNLTAMILGQRASVQTITEYSNYQK